METNFTYLHNQRIIYSKYPDAVASKEYDWGWYYENPVSGYYRVLWKDIKICYIGHLKYIMHSLSYLNQGISYGDFAGACLYISNSTNGFLHDNFTYSSNKLLEMIDEAYYREQHPPQTRPRRIVFKVNSGLTSQEKMAIAGKLIKNKRFTQEKIYNAMLIINETDYITNRKLASLIGCTVRTVQRNMSIELKEERKILNKQYEKV